MRLSTILILALLTLTRNIALVRADSTSVAATTIQTIISTTNTTDIAPTLSLNHLVCYYHLNFLHNYHDLLYHNDSLNLTRYILLKLRHFCYYLGCRLHGDFIWPSNRHVIGNCVTLRNRDRDGDGDGVVGG